MRIKGGGPIALTGTVTCAVCGCVVPRKSAEQRYCSRACWRTRYYEQPPRDRSHYQREQTKHGTSAPALKQACEALEAQLTALNQDEWPQIIARFGWARTPGYRDLARLTRQVIAAKRGIPFTAL